MWREQCWLSAGVLGESECGQVSEKLHALKGVHVRNKGSCGMHTLTCDVTGAVLTECRCVGEGGCGQVSKELHALKGRCPGTCLIAAHVQHVSSWYQTIIQMHCTHIYHDGTNSNGSATSQDLVASQRNNGGQEKERQTEETMDRQCRGTDRETTCRDPGTGTQPQQMEETGAHLVGMAPQCLRHKLRELDKTS